MGGSQNSLLTLVVFGGSALQRKEMIDKVVLQYPFCSDYDIVVVNNKGNDFNEELNTNSNVPIKVLEVDKGDSLSKIAKKVLNLCNSNYFIFQNSKENLYNLSEFVENIRTNSGSSNCIFTFTEPVGSKQMYLIEEVPSLFVHNNISNIAFPRSIVEESPASSDQYEWKVQSILKSQYVYAITIESENIIQDHIQIDFQELSEQIKSLIYLLKGTNTNKYIICAIVKNVYELIISTQIGVMYKKVIKEKKSNEQVQFLKNLENWIKEIDLKIFNSIPAIRYFFIRWSIDHYNFLSYHAKRQHIKIIKYIVNNMNFDSHHMYMKKHNKMFPAAILSAKLNSIIPIYLYLVKRKVTVVKSNKNKILANKKQHSTN